METQVSIRDAIRALVVADSQRGLQTVLVDVADKKQIGSLSAAAVQKPQDCKGNKLVIDAVYRALAPDYIMILGSHDVIPHQDMLNPLFAGRGGDDPDKYARGDLPYACDARYSNDPDDFSGPTRVIGRLPDMSGGTDARYLVSLLRTAAKYKHLDRDAYQRCFAVTAQVWEASTMRTLRAIFGSDRDLQKVPPHTFRWGTGLAACRVHFFNCHGAFDSSRFYGQPINRPASYPVALDASFMDGKIVEGTIAAAECCYGGQLYRLSSIQPHAGMCNVYLKNGAYGFSASTTIAYGPARTNGEADLICRYFIEGAREGASLGRAVLEARQKFARHLGSMDPSDFKTLAQFNLYGDPSISPVRSEQLHDGAAAIDFASARNERHARRRALAVQGRMLEYAVPKIRRTSARPPAAITRELLAHARKHKLGATKVMSFKVLLELFFQVSQSFASGICAQKIGDKIDQDVWATPFTRMHAANDQNERFSHICSLEDVQRMANARFAGFLRQLDPLAHPGVGRLDVDEARRNLCRVHDEGHGSSHS
jgi:hypothetical protein